MRGATEAAGNTKVEERFFVRRKASKSTDSNRGSWLRPVSGLGLNGTEEAAE
jgi:hypothetical protein